MRRYFPPLFVAGLFLFAAVALALATPLWRDEIALLAATGRTPMMARLLSAAAGAAAVALVGVLAAQLGVRRPWTAAALFAIFPAVLRAGAEAHLYTAALAGSIAATVIAVRLRERPAPALFGLYAVVLAGAAAVHPYAASVALAHAVWWIRSVPRRLTALAAAAAAAVALPVSLHAGPQVFGELLGAGAWGSMLAAAACLAASRPTLPARSLLLLLIALPAGGILAADAWNETQLATRQLLWVLPPVAILAAQALETPRGTLLTGGLAALCVLYSTQLYTPPAENWQVAADALSESARHGSCIAAAPPDSMGLYAFFHPELRDWPCSGDRLLLAVAPATPAVERDTALRSILAGGYAPESWGEAGGAELLVFGCVATAKSPAAATRCHPPLR